METSDKDDDDVDHYHSHMVSLVVDSTTIP